MTDQMTTIPTTGIHAEASTDASTTERNDLRAALALHRALLLRTVEGVNDRDAARRTTVSELCLGGILKHLAHTEGTWARFVEVGATAMGPFTPEAMQVHAASFRMDDGETLAGLVEAYTEVGARTDALIATIPSLDAAHALPDRPWFEPGAAWSARMAFLHILAETAQHAGHADILREAIDGAKTMG